MIMCIITHICCVFAGAVLMLVIAYNFNKNQEKKFK